MKKIDEMNNKEFMLRFTVYFIASLAILGFLCSLGILIKFPENKNTNEISITQAEEVDLIKNYIKIKKQDKPYCFKFYYYENDFISIGENYITLGYNDEKIETDINYFDEILYIAIADDLDVIKNNYFNIEEDYPSEIIAININLIKNNTNLLNYLNEIYIAYSK